MLFLEGMANPGMVKNGDLFSIKLQDDAYVVGIVINASKLFKMAMLISVYDILFTSIHEIDASDLPKKMIYGDSKGLPNYTGKLALTKGFWKHIGNFPKLLDDIEILTYKMGSTVYLSDIELSKYDEFGDLQSYQKILVSHGYESIGNILRKHFNL